MEMKVFQADNEDRRMRVFQSEDEERKFVHDPDEDFVASYIYGQWTDNKISNFNGMKELDAENDLYEVSMILRQARKALRMGW